MNNEIAELLLQAAVELEDRALTVVSPYLPNELRKAAAALQAEPMAYEFQHEETGQITFVDRQQIEWGFEKNNPRHQLIGPVYRTPQPAKVQECDCCGYPGHDLPKWREILRQAYESTQPAKVQAEPFALYDPECPDDIILYRPGVNHYLPLYKAPQPAKVPEGFLAKMEQHALSAGECPPGSRVVLLSAIQRLAAAPAAGEGET